MLAAGVVVLASAPIAGAGRRLTLRWFGRGTASGLVAERLSCGLNANTEASEALRVLAGTLREELRLSSVELALDGLPTCSVGKADPPPTAITLEYAQRRIGKIRVTARPGETLARPDRQLLAEVARYVAAAAEAIRTNEDLRQAQHSLETAHTEAARPADDRSLTRRPVRCP